jgi:hypothetical protein
MTMTIERGGERVRQASERGTWHKKKGREGKGRE